MKKAVIVGAGPIEEGFRLTEEENVFYVACDGGYRLFLRSGFEPDLFVGDFDTLNSEELRGVKSKIVLPVKKDDTDTFYAVKLLLEKGYESFDFYGCLGGKIDHTFANVSLLLYLLNHEAKGYLFSENNQNVVHMIRNSCIRLKPKKSGMLSVISYNGNCQGVSEEHLLYELHDQELKADVPLGISNQLIGEEAFISVREGTLLLVLPKDSYYES